MAFKKTSEGRVFFQGSGSNGNSSNDAPAAPRQSSSQSAAKPVPQRPDTRPEPGSANTGPTQLQILALLRSLNDKLKATQVERNTIRTELENYRRSVDQLQNKADMGARAEKIAQETLKEMAETRKILLDMEERQVGFEKETKSNAEKIRLGAGSYRDILKRMETSEQKQEEVVRKVEETAAQQAKIMRQIEKAIEDRTRFMRKIERIEETVIQTRDALNAKAMVLLTDQNIAGAPGNMYGADLDTDKSTQQEPGIPAAVPEEEIHIDTWTNSRTLQAAAILLLVAGGILAGWAVSEIQRPALTEAGEFQISEYNAPIAPGTTAAEKAAQENVDPIVDKWRVSKDTSAFSEGQAQTAPRVAAAMETPDTANDIGAIDLNDQAAIQKMLEEDPDALAAELNKLESSAPAAEETPVAAAPKPKAEETQIASLPVEQQANIEQDTPQITEPLATAPPPPVYTKSNVDVRSLISPDSALPEVVKKIETQAFDGVPEAQHDLAAIYTAGHAGVKQDFKRALFWFEQSANAGVANAAYNLGVLYHQGLGTKPDLAKAISWYTRAADLGHPEGQYNLGIAYIEGVGVKYDPFKANAYFEKAAVQGIMEATYNLGLIHENGLLGKPQPDEALVWYKDAADKGSPEARAALEQLVKTLGIRMEDINKLVDDVKSSRKAGNAATAPSPVVPSEKTGSVMQGDEALRAQVQEYLMGMGLYPGPADGTDSPISQDAIRAYQSLNGMPTNGQASEGLLVHMLSDNSNKAPGAYN